MSTRDPIVIVGAGLAGTRCAVTLRRLAPDRPVVLLGDEPRGAYERPPLSKEYLAGTRSADELALPGTDDDSLRALGIDARRAVSVVAIEPGRVLLEDGGELAASVIVLATGARPRALPTAAPADRVHVLRSLDDAVRLRAAMRPGARLGIVGSGFVGAEVASTALGAGVRVTMVDAVPVPFARTLGDEVGSWLARRWRDAGVELHLGSGVDGIDGGRETPVSIRLAGDVTIDVDEVLVAIGTIPNDELFHDAFPGIGAPGAGIPTDRDGCTPVGGIWAAGDVAQVVEGAAARRVEHWTDAAMAAERVARSIVGAGGARASTPYAWSDQFGIRLQFAGRSGAPLQAHVDDLGEETLLVHYRDGDGHLHGVTGIGHPRAVAQCRSELAA